MDIKTQCVTSLVVLVYVINMSRVAALSCPEGLKQYCIPAEELSCKGGLTKDPCGFCTVCAKVERERCGGPWGVMGECDEGLECHKTRSAGTPRWPWEFDHAVGVCRNMNRRDVCLLPSETGACRGYFPMFFYNAEKMQCERFIYGGCGGNRNNFWTWQACMKSCHMKPVGPMPMPR